jgi:His-Xaa-Ser system radical SAM maturase HxsB
MAISIGGEEQHVLNHYRSRKLGEGYLVTNDYGTWVYLSEREHKDLKSNNVSGALYSTLKDKGLAVNNKNIKDIIYDYRRKSGFLFQGTSLHIIVPTLRCNLKCIYCHAKAKPINSGGFDMTEETAKKAVDFIFQSPSKAITIEFQGGEPLLRFDIVKYVVDYAKELNKACGKDLQFSAVTNLTTMTEEIIDYFKQQGVGICTSIDGPEIVHNKNRQEYEKVVGWAKKILESYTLNAMLLTTKYTLQYPKEIVDQYFELGLPRMWIKPANRLAFADDNWDEIGFTAEEYLDFWKQAMDYIVEKNKERKFVENYARILLLKILTKDGINFTDLQSPCGAAIGQLAYNYDGSIFTCDEGRLFEVFRLGTVDNKYSDIVTSNGACSTVRASINDNPVCEVCAYKPYCGLCPVCSYAETGNVISSLPNRRCRILIGMFDYIFEKLLNDEGHRKVFLSWIEKPEGHQNI